MKYESLSAVSGISFDEEVDQLSSAGGKREGARGGKRGGIFPKFASKTRIRASPATKWRI